MFLFSSSYHLAPHMVFGCSLSCNVCLDFREQAEFYFEKWHARDMGLVHCMSPKHWALQGNSIFEEGGQEPDQHYTAMQPVSCFEIECYRELTCRYFRFGSIAISKLLNQFPTTPQQNSRCSIPGWACQKAFMERELETKILSRMRVRRFGIMQPRSSQASISIPHIWSVRRSLRVCKFCGSHERLIVGDGSENGSAAIDKNILQVAYSWLNCFQCRCWLDSNKRG